MTIRIRSALDYMHLVCLGVMYRLVPLWICGPRLTKLSVSIAVVPHKFVRLQSHMPTNFSTFHCLPCTT